MMRRALLVAALAVVVLPPCCAAQIRCEVSDPAVAVALDRLKGVAADAPFAGFDYEAALQPAPKAGGLGRDGFEIRPATVAGHRTLSVRAETPIGLAYGLVRIVRIGLSAPERLGSATVRMNRALPIREVYEERGWDNPQELEANRARLRWFFEQGYNRLDLPFGWWMPPPDDMVDPAAWHRRWDPAFATARQIIDYAHGLGIEVYLVENPQFSPYNETPLSAIREPYRSQPRPLSGEAYMLCPSEPANVALARRRAEYLYRQLANADGILVYFGDPGGCPCANCNPWGKTILRLCRDLYAPLLAEVVPRWKMAVTTWCVPRPDVAFVVGHLDEFPPVMAGLQMPPNAPSPPYLIYDPPMVRELVQAAAKREVVMQQFLDGVGFRNGWVNFVEHPMPVMIERGLRGSLAGGKLAGVYSSAFDCYLQQVGTRLIGEWGLNPDRSAREILTELGAEWFGPATGEDFAAAMAAMERYWDVAYDQFFADGPTEGHVDAAPLAAEAQAAMRHVAARTVRNRDHLRSFTALADAMVRTSQVTADRAQAARLDEGGHSAEAVGLLREAKRNSERIAHLLSVGCYTYLPKSVFWREQWVIRKRAETIAQDIAQIEAPGEWQPVAVPDADFRKHTWSVASVGKVEWIEEAGQGGVARLDNSQAEGKWSAIASPLIAATANAPFRITFAAKRAGGGGTFWAQWLDSKGGELGARMMVDMPADGRWHRTALKGIAPAVPPGEKVMIRFVLVSPAIEARIAHLELQQKPPPGSNSTAR